MRTTTLNTMCFLLHQQHFNCKTFELSITSTQVSANYQIPWLHFCQNYQNRLVANKVIAKIKGYSFLKHSVDWAAVSVRLSICGVPRLNSRTEKPRKPKIGRMVARHACIPWTYLEVKRSKVKVTRSVNAHTVNAQYLPNATASMTSAMTSRSTVNVARSREWRDASDRFWPISWERNVPETPKLV